MQDNLIIWLKSLFIILLLALLAFLATSRAFASDYLDFPEEDADDVMSADDHYYAQRLKKKLIGNKPVYRKEKSSRIHDSVTIIIEERTTADVSTSVDLKRDAGSKWNLNKFFTPRFKNGNFQTIQRGKESANSAGQEAKVPDLDFSNSRTHKSDSKADREQTLRSMLTGEIIEVLPNNYLVVEARKRLLINGETQIVIVTGTVNPDYMNSNNEVNAKYVMDMSVSFDGKGPLSRMNKRGWGAQILDFLNPF